MAPRLSVAVAIGLVAATTTVGFGSAVAQSADPSATSAHKLGPKLRLARSVVRRSGLDLPVFEPTGLPTTVESGGIGATLRFRHRLDDRGRQALQEAGVDLTTDIDGEPVSVGPVYSAFLPWSSFGALSDHPALIRAEAAWYPVVETPLEVTARKVGAVQIRRRATPDLDGRGTLIGDVDSGFDIFHPHLFRADGGSYAWVDVNGNAVLDSGVDGVDLDGDGTIDDDERLRVLDATVDLSVTTRNDDGVLQTTRDWVYVDVNGDGRRNVGPAAGFTEATPAYGEPIFVADDVNKDTRLGPEERLVRLETSKFRKVLRGSETYVRGQNLIELGKPEPADRPSHGTAVASILVGGQPGYHDRTGLAPGAEMVGYAYAAAASDSPGSGHSRHIRFIDDAIDSGVDVLVHQWADLFSTPMDGSTNVEAAMDRARRAGVVQVTPMGNMNHAAKHTEISLKPRVPRSLPFRVGDGYRQGGARQPYRRVWMALSWRTDQRLNIDLRWPGGKTVTVPKNGQKTLQSLTISARSDISPRGTRQRLIVMWQKKRWPLPKGSWNLLVDGVQKPDTLMGRITDKYSGWDVGIHWKDPTTNHSTLVYPATADSAFGVAAWAGRHPSSTASVGQLRDYSGRGPRIDGARAVDIAAPDDPFVALGGPSALAPSGGSAHGWFRRFGGTSGAGPHVAATMAMLAQKHPGWGPDKLESTITASADTKGLTPHGTHFPNRHWGQGKLNAYRAVTGRDIPEENAFPAARLRADIENAEVRLDASASSDPEGEPLEYRFDYDYDGNWDTAWGSEPTATIALTAYTGYGTLWARVSVRDAAGQIDGALAAFIREAPADVAEPVADTGPEVGADTAMAYDTAPEPTPDTEVADTGLDTASPQRADPEPDGWNGRPTPPDDSGCKGCSEPPGSSPPVAALVGLLGGLLAVGRRRERR